MTSLNSSFPPFLLEKCLDITRNLSQLKTGKASLKINLGSSSFDFSLDLSANIQTGSSSQANLRKKKKSPSDQRRSALRREKFLEEKRNANLHPVASSPKPPPTDLSKLSLISEAPMTIDTSEAMATDSCNQAILQEAVKNPVLGINEARNSVIKVPVHKIAVTVNDSTHIQDSENQHLPPAISPISSPSPTISDPLPFPLNQENKTPPHTEKALLVFCARNQAAAAKYGKKFPKSSYQGPHPKNKTHHFQFSTQLSASNLSKMKTDLDQLVKLPKTVHLLIFKVLSEGKAGQVYVPKEKEYCQECANQHVTVDSDLKIFL